MISYPSRNCCLIPEKRKTSNEQAPKAEIARVSRLIHQRVGTRRIRGTVKSRRRIIRKKIKRDIIGMVIRKLRLRRDRQRKGVRLPLRGSLRRSVAAVYHLSEIKLSAVKVGVDYALLIREVERPSDIL